MALAAPATPNSARTADLAIAAEQAAALEAGSVVLNRAALLHASFAYFMANLKDEAGNPLRVDEHHEEWADLFQHEALVCLLAPRDHGKALPLDTPIPTPTGWTPMGALVDGDVVLDERGLPTRVTKAHPVRLERDCYRVRFDDGTEVVADGEHLWETWDKAARTGGGTPAVRTTTDIRATLVVGREHNHSIPMAEPLVLPEAALPLDPYLLGVWLGDGTEREASINIHEAELVATIEATGTALRRRADPFQFGMAGVTAPLRALGVLGNKHIPMTYLRASVEQRRALLAGLMDTDGHAALDGTVEFTTTRPVLAEQVAELAVSLGFKVRTYEGRSTIKGRDVGPKWRLCWSPRTQVFRLARKQARVDAHPERGWRTRHRFIVAVEPVESVPVRCITVDSPRSLYLAGRQMVPTHNTWTEVAYMLWRVWRHNRDPITGEWIPSNPEGKFEAVLFSLTLQTAEVFFELFQNLLWANLELFEDIRPRAKVVKASNEKWSKRQVRLRNLASVIIRGFRSSARGLHPDLIILDDVLDDQTTLTQYQRDKAWRYFAGTLIPMAAKQYIVIGTAFHLDDLLHRLKPRKNKPVLLTVGRRRVVFRWVKFRSVNWESGEVLWPWKHDLEDLRGRRDLDPLLFSREMQNDPIDDASSLFPYSLTGRAKREDLAFQPLFVRDVGEFVIAGEDLAVGATASSDFTVLWVATYQRATGRMRLIWGERHQGLEFDDQVKMLRNVCRTYGVDLAVVESNVFQSWLRQSVAKYPETAGRVVGHRTGSEKADFTDGVPSMRLALEHDLWDFPAGDPESVELFAIWQAEMAAYGWKDGKLMGIGEHDDTVMAWYMLDRARKLLEEWLAKAEAEADEVVTGEDLGIERVRIGAPY